VARAGIKICAAEEAITGPYITITTTSTIISSIIALLEVRMPSSLGGVCGRVGVCVCERERERERGRPT
jgi:hypothetical protein